jgi:endoglycosylceramidase
MQAGAWRRALVVAVAVSTVACSSDGGGDSGGGGADSGRETSTTAGAPDDGNAARGAVAPLGGTGRWLTDAEDRVVLLHGVNEVAKSSPFHPAAFGFGADDASFLAEHGFDVVRLGVVFEGLMPEPGVVDQGYLDALAATVEELAAAHVFVLLDFHQDGFAPRYNGNGLPDWMAIDDGQPNPPDAVFPLYYVQNPAMQRAFESFWANRPGPDGVGVQDSYITGLVAVAERFAEEPYVFGYELMNEPWPGEAYETCATAAGCADIEQAKLAPFHEKATEALRAVAGHQLVFVEPFVLFNFGQSGTSMPGASEGTALSTHSYALDETGEQAVVDFSVEAAERDRAPVVITEFGATTDAAVLQRLTAQFDGGLLPWIVWAYNEEIITERDQPASLDQLADGSAFEALVRPRAVAIAGTPTATSFDPASAAFSLAYRTERPGGGRYPAELVTVVSVPELHYPAGYAVEVSGATVTSEPCARTLTLRAEPAADEVGVEITPSDSCPT